MIDRILLFPYYLILKWRDRYYSRPGRKFYTPAVPSLCVGNVTAGGTGKTPMVELVLRTLQGSEEWDDKNLAVLSRGYKRESRGFQQVVADGAASMFGDEPLQIKKKFPGVTVAVDKNRVEGCEFLQHPDRLASGKNAKKCWYREFPAADFIVFDDAFQYRKLKAARTMVLVDWNRPVSSDMLLPFGRLRDLPERAGDADILVVTKCPAELNAAEREAFASRLGITGYSSETCEGVSARGRRQTVLFAKIKYGQPVGVYPKTEARYVYSKKIILVSGIAKDTPLRDYLSDFYKIEKRFGFPDHHKYRWSDITKIQIALRKNPTASVFTTEKDAQRLLDFPGMPEEIAERLFMVPIETEFLSEVERNVFRDRIVSL